MSTCCGHFILHTYVKWLNLTECYRSTTSQKNWKEISFFNFSGSGLNFLIFELNYIVLKSLKRP